MFSWLIRTSIGLLITPSEIERARTWVFQTAAMQALTQAHAQGFRSGYLAACDDIVMADIKQQQDSE